MKIVYKLHGFQFKRAEFTVAFQKAIRLELRNAARAFAQAVIARVPVRTGFARGSLLNLTDGIGLSAASNPALFRQKLKKRRQGIMNVSVNGLIEYYTGHGGRVLKTPENARPYSTPIGKVFTDDGRRFSFNYTSTITYYILNEEKLGWQSFAAGSEAFKGYLDQTGLSRLPAITNYLIKETKNG